MLGQARHERVEDAAGWCAGGGSRRWLWVLALAWAIAVIPVLIVPMPPLLDYPNHLARLWLLSGGAGEAPFPDIYAVDWSAASTNILIDLVAGGIGRFVPIAILGPALLSASLLLPAIGVAMLGRAALGRWSWWHVLGALPAFGAPFLLGFLNFQIGLGLALIGAALDAGIRAAGLRIAFRIAWAVLLLIAHPFALLFHAALLGGLAIGSHLRSTRPGDGVPAQAHMPGRVYGWGLIARPVFAVLPAVAVVVLYWLMAHHPGRGASPAMMWLPLRLRIDGLFGPMRGYDGAVGAGMVAVIWGLLFVARATDALKIHAGLAMAAALIAIASLAMPQIAFDTGQLTIRLPEMAWLTLIAAVLPGEGWNRHAVAAAATVALVAVAMRTSDIARVWLARRGDAAALSRALAQVPPGARILPLDHMPPDGVAGLPPGRALGAVPTTIHLVTLAIFQRHAFVPTLFAFAGKQVVAVRSPFDQIAVPEGTLATVDRLGALTGASDDAVYYPYLLHWRCFDYVLVLNADVPNAGGPLHVNGVEPVADAGFARLYRVSGTARSGCALPGLRRQ